MWKFVTFFLPIWLNLNESNWIKAEHRFRFPCEHQKIDRKTIAKVFNLSCLCEVRKCWLHKSGGGKESIKAWKVLIRTLILFTSTLFCCELWALKPIPMRNYEWEKKVTIYVAFLKCHSDPKLWVDLGDEGIKQTTLIKNHHENPTWLTLSNNKNNIN